MRLNALDEIMSSVAFSNSFRPKCFPIKGKIQITNGFINIRKQIRNYLITNISELIEVKTGFSFQYKIKVVNSVRL